MVATSLSVSFLYSFQTIHYSSHSFTYYFLHHYFRSVGSHTLSTTCFVLVWPRIPVHKRVINLPKCRVWLFLYCSLQLQIHSLGPITIPGSACGSVLIRIICAQPVSFLIFWVTFKPHASSSGILYSLVFIRVYILLLRVYLLDWTLASLYFCVESEINKGIE